MKQRFLTLLILILGLLAFAQTDLSAQSGGLDSLFLKNQNDTHVKIGWNTVPGIKTYVVDITIPSQTWQYTTTNSWWKINKTFLENNNDVIIDFSVKIEYHDGTFSSPIRWALVEVEIIYQACEDGDIIQGDYMPYTTKGNPEALEPMPGTCICDYKTVVSLEYAGTQYSAYVPDCNSDCHIQYSEPQYFTYIFSTPAHLPLVYEYIEKVCPEGAPKTGERTIDSPFYTFSPNPMNNSLMVKNHDLADNNAVYLRIYNTNGRLMIEKDLSNSFTTEVSTENLAPGMYLANIISNGEILQRTKLLKF